MEKIMKNNKDGNVTESIFPHADEAIENAKSKGKSYWKKAKSNWQEAKGIVQKNPVRAMGYAVLLGAIISYLLSFKKQSK